MTTTRFFASQSFSNLGAALPQIVRFMMNDHATITGPAWSLVEAQSGGNREVPSDPADLDSLVSATDWKNDSIAPDDWVVLESVGGVVSSSFQLYIEYQDTVRMNIIMMPLADFSTGGGAASPPTFPSTAVGNGSSLITYGGGTGGNYSLFATYNVIADEGMMAFIFDQGNCDWSYIGEVDSVYNSGSIIKDPRPFVIHDVVGAISLGNTSFNRLSPKDNSTVLTQGSVMGMIASGFLYLDAGGSSGPGKDLLNNGLSSGSGYTTVAPWGAIFEDNGHEHVAGWLRNVYTVGEGLSSGNGSGNHSGTMSGTNFDEHGIMFRSHNSTRPGVAFKWDGATAYGSTTYSGTFNDSPDMVVRRSDGGMGFFSVPKVGEPSSVTTNFVSNTNVDRHKLRQVYPFKRKKNTDPGTLK